MSGFSLLETRTGLSGGRGATRVPPDSVLRRMECRACPLNSNLAALHPKMPAAGSLKPTVYVLGEWPSTADDRAGRHFAGDSGERLRAEFPEGSRVRWNNVIRDRPQGKPRPPSPVEVTCCRPSIERDIVETGPRVILAVGPAALSWFGAGGGMPLWRGRVFPFSVVAPMSDGSTAAHSVYVAPVPSPTWVLQKENAGRDGANELERETARLYGRDIGRAFALAKRDPFKPAAPIGGLDLKRPVMLWRLDQRDELRRRLLQAIEADVVTVDFEATHVRPYFAGFRLLTCSFDFDGQVFAVGLDHPESIAAGLIKDVKAYFIRAGQRRKKIVAQNASFEIEAAAVCFGLETMQADWHCTMAQSFVLDEREGGHDLGFLTFLNFGFDVKKLSKVDVKRLIDEPLENVLLYNGFDAEVTARLFHRQNERLAAAGLAEIYGLHRLRIPALVDSQIKGVLIDVPAARRKHERFGVKIKKLRERIHAMESVRTYEKRHGQFNHGTPQHVARLLTDEGHGDALKTAKGGMTTADDVVSKVKHELVRPLLMLRGMEKLDGTYAAKFLPEHPKTLIYPDGRLHTHYTHTDSETGRTTSRGPNLQNFPKRKNKEARRIVTASPGNVLVAIDYGQIEYRVLVCLSKDPAALKAIRERFDIHQFWAERIIKIYPSRLKRHLITHKDLAKAEARKESISDFRGDVKNQFVFPSFFGASEGSCAGYLDVPREVTREIYPEFWSHHAGVKRWQNALLEDYRAKAYVENPFGRRRRGPLNKSMIINTPVQSAATDVVMNAQVKLWNLSVQMDMPWLSPALEIHDDLTFDCPRNKVDDLLSIAVPIMLEVDFSWIIVPLQVDVEIGRPWNKMQKAGKYYGDEI